MTARVFTVQRIGGDAAAVHADGVEFPDDLIVIHSAGVAYSTSVYRDMRVLTDALGPDYRIVWAGDPPP